MAGEQGFHVATAYVTVEPDAADFPEKLKAELEGVDYTVKVPIDPEMARFNAEVRAGTANQPPVEVPIDPNASGFREKLAAATAGEKPVEVPVEPRLSVAGFLAKLDLARIAAYISETFGAAVESSKIGLASSAMLAKMNAGLADSFGLVQTRAASAALSEKALADVNESLANSIFKVGVAEKIAADLQDSAASHQDLLNASRLAGVGATLALAKAGEVLAATDPVTLAMSEKTTVATDQAAAAAVNLGGRWGALNAVMARSVPLFGGVGPAALTAIGGIHLLVQGIAEVGAVLIPATIAFGAFAAAAAPSVQDIVHKMQDLQTVTQATGQNIAPLSGGFTKVADAVRPQVYQIFGDALTVINAKTGSFAALATAAGKALDSLSARAALALQSGGFSQFLKNAGPDLLKVGTFIGNVFGSLGNVLKQLPGYAQYAFNALNGVTHVIENVTGSGIGQKILGFGMAFHGAFIYAGLGAQALASTMRGGLTMIGNWAEKAAMAAGDSNAFGGALAKAAPKLFGFAAGAADLAALPWGWIAIAAAGVGVLAYKILTAKDATQQWVASLQTTIMAAPIFQGMTAIMSAQTQVTHRLSAATQTYGTAIKEASLLSTRRSPQYAQETRRIAELTSAQQQLSDQSVLYNYRLDKLSVSFGGNARAMGLLVAAGITMKQMLDKTDWAQIAQQVLATEQAYQAMGQRAGVLGADLNALSIAGSDQVAAMGKLNSAWDTSIGIVSGGQGAFITFQQDLLSVNEAFQQTGGSTRTVTNTFAAASAAAKAAGASMTGLNAPSLQLRATWQAAFGGGVKLIDALRMMSSVSPSGGGFPSITRAIKDTITQLVPFGKQSSATRAELVSLAQEVNPNITSFKDLTTWLGHTHNAARDLNKILAASGIDIQSLTADAAAMSNTLQSAVVSKFTLTKMAADGTNAAISKLATDMGHGASASKIAGDAMSLFTLLTEKGGYSAKGAAALVSTLTGTIFKVPKGWTTKFNADTAGAITNVHDLGDAIRNIHGKAVSIDVLFNIHGGTVPGTGINLPGLPGGGPIRKATGGVLPGYAPGVDDQLALLSPGEGVLVPEAVRALGPEFVHAANRKFGGARVARGNKAGTFATGGISASAHYQFPQDIFNILVNMPGAAWVGGGSGGPFGDYGQLAGELKPGSSIARMHASGLTLAKAFASDTLTTVAQIRAEATLALKRIREYYSGPAANELTVAIRAQTHAMENLAQKSAQVSATIRAMKALAAQETSSLASWSNISNITGAVNPATGQAGPVTGQDIQAGLQHDLAQLHKFFMVIKKLQQAKVSKVMIGQVIALGPDQGIIYGEAILSGGKALIAEINKEEKLIGREERLVGQETADVQYGQNIGKGVGKGFLSGLREQRAQLDREMTRLGDEIARELARAFGVPLKDIPHLGPAPGAHHHAAHHGHHHGGGAGRPPGWGGGHWGAPIITVNLNGSKGKLSHEEVTGISHEISRQLALA